MYYFLLPFLFLALAVIVFIELLKSSIRQALLVRQDAETKKALSDLVDLKKRKKMRSSFLNQEMHDISIVSHTHPYEAGIMCTERTKKIEEEKKKYFSLIKKAKEVGISDLRLKLLLFFA